MVAIENRDLKGTRFSHLYIPCVPFAYVGCKQNSHDILLDLLPFNTAVDL